MKHYDQLGIHVANMVNSELVLLLESPYLSSQPFSDFRRVNKNYLMPDTNAVTRVIRTFSVIPIFNLFYFFKWLTFDI